MSRLRRLVVSDRYFFITCNLLRARRRLDDDDFEVVARVIEARRAAQGFLLTSWVFLPDHWHAILGVRYPKTISLVMEAVNGEFDPANEHAAQGTGPAVAGTFF